MGTAVRPLPVAPAQDRLQLKRDPLGVTRFSDGLGIGISVRRIDVLQDGRQRTRL